VMIAMLLPVLFLAPWPYAAAPLLLAAGLGIRLVPLRPEWPKRLAGGMIAAGAILLVQSVGLFAYEAFTARFSDVPAPLASLLAWVAGLAGLDVAPFGTELPLFTMRQVHRLGATWGLLLDPATWCFLVGGVAWLAVRGPNGAGLAGALRSAARFALPVLLWLPIRAVLLMAIYLHRALRTGYDDPLTVLPDQFWDRWVLLGLLIVPVLLAWRFVRAAAGPEQPPADSQVPSRAFWKPWAPAGLALLAAIAFVAADAWDPAGPPKPGRILVDDYHSGMPWPRKEFDTVRTDKPFDTEWWGHASAYNHYCLYEYCDRFFTMSRQFGPIDANALANVDVLVLKVPSGPYSPGETDAVRAFVERGGGLLLLGEHTSVYGSGVYLNQLAERLGLGCRFRYDCAFGIDSVFVQRYEPPLLPHPILQYMPPMHYATSCTVEPGGGGRVVGRATGLKNLLADYHASNFYPQAKDRPDMRYGAFTQLWATRLGQGRVVAFTDSTIFSNFCVFEPGKTEIMVGMLAWLNHTDGMGEPRAWLIPLALVLAAAAVGLGALWKTDALVVLAAAALGWSVGVPLVRAANRAAVPPPARKRHMIQVGIDRTVCDANLPRNGFIAGRTTHFGQFERTILRLGYFTFRASDEELNKASMIVLLHPNQPVGEDFKAQLVEYVREGGKLLVLDSPENAKSTANRLLYPFGESEAMEFNPPYRPIQGRLSVPADWPAPTVKAALAVKGGTPFAEAAGRVVGAWKKFGKGKVWAVGFGSRFTDNQMGYIGDVTPKGDLVPVFDLVFRLIRAVAEDSPTTPPVPPAAAPKRAIAPRPAVPPATRPAPKPAPAPQTAPRTRPAAATQPARR